MQIYIRVLGRPVNDPQCSTVFFCPDMFFLHFPDGIDLGLFLVLFVGGGGSVHTSALSVISNIVSLSKYLICQILCDNN